MMKKLLYALVFLPFGTTIPMDKLFASLSFSSSSTTDRTDSETDDTQSRTHYSFPIFFASTSTVASTENGISTTAFLESRINSTESEAHYSFPF